MAPAGTARASADTSSPTQNSSAPTQSTQNSAPRFYARRFPPTSMGPVLLPFMSLSATPGTASQDQSVEFTKLVRRAMVREMLPSGTGQKMADELLGEIESAEMKQERDERLKEAGEIAEARCRIDVGEETEGGTERLAQWFLYTMNRRV